MKMLTTPINWSTVRTRRTRYGEVRGMDRTGGPRPAGPSRRRFLIGLGVGVASATSLGAALFGSTPQMTNGALDDEWLFGEYVAGCTDIDFDDSRLATVTVPHCVTSLSWQGWQPSTW